MNVKHQTSEKGQAVVFLVVGLVVFLGFVALAVDGGMAYSDRRHAQNSSDSSSLAGGGAAAEYMEDHFVYYSNWDGGCENDIGIFNARLAAVDDAIARAAANGFPIDTDPSDGNWVTTACGETDYGYIDRWIDVTVHISTTTETSFAQILFPKALVNRVDATTRVRPRTPLAFGHAIVALNPADCPGNQNGIIFGGTGDTEVHGGGIWSNGCLKSNGGAFGVDVIDGDIRHAGPYIPAEPGQYTPEPEPAPYPIPPSYFEVPFPECPPNKADWYDGSDIEGNLDPGLYCVDGNLNLDDVIGYGVTIVVDGNISVNGGPVIHLDAPAADPDPDPAVPGVLFYVINGDITINGNSDQWYMGLIYNQDGDCSFSGTGGTWDTLHTQIVCNNVEVTGTAQIDINFDAGQQYSKPTSIELFE